LRNALLTSISHDLKTPLARVLGAAETLGTLSDVLNKQERADLIATVIGEAERLNRFIANLLDMTKLESGAVVPNAALHDLGEIIGSALERASKILAQHRVELGLARDLPMVEVDPVLFEQLLFNLLDNAAKYAPAGTTIRIQSWRDRDMVGLQVLDEGEGIPPTDLERIFDKFYRVQKADHVRAGTGLGLAISRGFMEAMHGTITARSNRSGWRSVYNHASDPDERQAIGHGRMSASPPKVLVIDDEPPIRKLLRMGLSAHGYEILEAPSGRIALEQLEQEKPDLVILDLGLPDIQGLDLLRMIRSRNESVPIVVLSSRGDEAGKVQALDLGADDYVTKPFGMDELLARMRAALRHQLQTHGERPIFRVGDLAVDLVRRIVRMGDKDVKLSPKEYDLLRVLVQHAGKVLTHKFLLGELWDDLTDAQYLRVYVRQLRQKIEADPERPQYILTETGIGYRLRSPD
jgi:two-component system KDP operon response regulator KdpE